ncbi:MAG: hypothetical protein GWP91_15565, partial [Rhodobacterales bacterium]|nr:hypothetical protein [Rhodobacterales bacterium]
GGGAVSIVVNVGMPDRENHIGVVVVDEAATATTACYGSPGTVSNNQDCDDTQVTVNPSNVLEFCNGFDDNCNGLVDDADPNIFGAQYWYLDDDGDGYGSIGSGVTAAALCLPPPDYGDNLDCDDGDLNISPDGVEICDGVDNNCDLTIDEGLADFDYDGTCDTMDPCPASNPDDSDLDGLCLFDEEQLGTDPLDPDTDDDSVPDGDEFLVFMTDPLNPDTDGDTVPDGAEVLVFMTDPLLDERDCFVDWPETDLSTGTVSAQSVYATDLDNDGDADVLSASAGDNRIAWYENLGDGTFGTMMMINIATDALTTTSVYATDLDNDGDADVLFAAQGNNRIAWYENLGGGSFGPMTTITTSALGANSVYATDLDNDGYADVLSTSYVDHRVAWYKNNGDGTFTTMPDITTSALSPQSVYATDLNGDGFVDVVSASQNDDRIAWYANDGVGGFGPMNTLTTGADGAVSVYATDLDGDGDADVLSASYNDDRIAWYENLGGGSFGPMNTLTISADFAVSVYATDLDGDGDADVLSSSTTDDRVAWYQNDGSGNFGPMPDIAINAGNPYSVYATDLDGDGDADVLSASAGGDRVAWYENRWTPTDTDRDGLFDDVEECITSTDPNLWDTDGGGTSDGDETLMLTDPKATSTDDLLPADADADGLSDVAENWWYGTNPLAADTDADGIDDYDEVQVNTDPLEPLGP